MPTIHLKMVIPPCPWTRAIVDGTVTIPGLSWDCISNLGSSPDRFDATKRYDVGENGIRNLALDVLKGKPAVAIPVFFNREHMQRNIIVRDDSPLLDPTELAGKRVGSGLTIVSGTLVGVMVMLEQVYGVPLADIEWHSGNPDALVTNRMGLTVIRGLRGTGENLDRLLRGELDAVIVTTGPRYWSMFGGGKLDQVLASRPALRSLISNPEVIAAAYKRTGLYPITDIGVVNAHMPQLHPGLPARLVEVFSQANDLAPQYRSREEEALAQREIELLGEDPYRYGFGENPRHNLAALLNLLARLGALERTLDPEELFVPGTYDSL